MTASNERTVVLGLMSYIDENGAHRVANAGAVVKVHPDRLARFDRLNVLYVREPEPAQVAAPVEVESTPEELANDAGAGEGGEGESGAGAEPGSNPDSAEVPTDAWTIAQMQAYADAKTIDLGDAVKKADILAAIQAATSKG